MLTKIGYVERMNAPHDRIEVYCLVKDHRLWYTIPAFDRQAFRDPEAIMKFLGETTDDIWSFFGNLDRRKAEIPSIPIPTGNCDA